LPVTLILDNVRNPDNFGAILRVAAAVGCKRVVAMQGCVDPWQSKVLRAAAGAHFFVPISRDVAWDKVHRHVPEYPQVVLADLARGDDVSEQVVISEKDLSQKLSELEGRCKQVHFQEDYEKPVGLESLAGEEEEVVSKRLDEVSVKPEDQHAGYRDYSYYDEDILNEYASLPLVSRSYRQFERFNARQELVIVIGGETEGISEKAKKFTHANLGERLFIPIRSKIDSLNVVSATSIILFELQKSFPPECIK
jgi:tRNA G18 (ribose-2'-O)-methylase SpoU